MLLKKIAKQLLFISTILLKLIVHTLGKAWRIRKKLGIGSQVPFSISESRKPGANVFRALKYVFVVEMCLIIITTTLFRCQVYFAGQRPTMVNGDLSHDRHTHKRRYVSEGLRFNVLIREDVKL